MHWATMEATNRKNKNPTLMCVLLRPFLIALFVEICVFQVSCSKTSRHIDRCFMPYISSWIPTFFRVHLCGGLPTRLHLYRLNLDMLRNELRINFIYCSFSWISFNQDKMVISFDLTLCSVFVGSIVYRIIRQAFFSLRIVIINIDTAFANSLFSHICGIFNIRAFRNVFQVTIAACCTTGACLVTWCLDLVYGYLHIRCFSCTSNRKILF